MTQHQSPQGPRRPMPQEFPVLTRPRPARIIRPSQVTVPITPLKVLPYTPRRLALAVINTGAATVFLGTNGTVNTTNGFPIPGGASVNLDQYIGEVWMVTAIPTLIGLLEMEL